jgi:hypothetical protein
MRNPACCRAEIADSRPEPGPLTLISTSRTPLRIAVLAQRCAACCAAKGVLLRAPLKPTEPPERAQTVLPSKSVIVINVLLNVAFMCTIARTMFFLTFRFVPFAIIFLVFCNFLDADFADCFLFLIHRVLYQFVVNIPFGLLAFFLYTLLACDCFSWAFAGARVTLSVLAPNRQPLSVTDASITVYIAQASYILSDLPAKPASHDVIAVNDLRYPAKLVLAQLAGLCAFFDPGFFQDLFRGVLTYTINIGQRNPY